MFSFLLQGIILSGGQKQRIGVARAMYQQTNVIFLVSLFLTESAGLDERAISI